MRLVSIINCWSDTIELLPFCIKNHLEFCDNVIVIWSQHSNHGVKNDAVLEYILANGHDSRVQFHQKEPQRGKPALFNEMMKRNCGIMLAKGVDYTHFLIADADECYIPSEMNAEKKRFDNPNLNGLVHPLKVYIKLPTLFTFDHTLCCGIHKLNKDTSVGNFKSYPFAYDSAGKAHIDPSRRCSHTSGIEMSKAYMHHLSYIRKDIDLKIDNSSANLKRSRQVIYDELRDAKPGYVSKLYHQPLQSCDNFFNIQI